MVCLGAPATAAQEFAAKSVNVVVGFAPGGGYDLYGRLLARHLGRHLPGQPTVVNQNMPGGGSLNLANFTANAAPTDGSHVALVNAAAALEPVLGNAQAKFETAKIAWIGNMNKDGVGCAAWTASGVTTWEEAVKRKARFGGVGAAGTSSQHAYFLQHMLDAPIQVITGYRGTNEINLALQRGEVDVNCGLFTSSLRGSYRADYEAGRLKVIIQFGKTKEPYFKDAVSIYEFVKKEEDRQLTEFIFGQVELTRPVMTAPGTPPAVLKVLREAFDKTMRDPEFLKDAEKGQIDIQPMSGDDTAALVARYAAVPPAIARRAQVVLKPK
jgi:tripartite-type tricarboxylate transporter receptor subunit TctC